MPRIRPGNERKFMIRMGRSSEPLEEKDDGFVPPVRTRMRIPCARHPVHARSSCHPSKPRALARRKERTGAIVNSIEL